MQLIAYLQYSKRHFFVDCQEKLLIASIDKYHAILVTPKTMWLPKAICCPEKHPDWYCMHKHREVCNFCGTWRKSAVRHLDTTSYRSSQDLLATILFGLSSG